jgi:mannose/cellobiose epimerase-like protein (N-acyl-D-glucosamine 2-epimerase family)
MDENLGCQMGCLRGQTKFRIISNSTIKDAEFFVLASEDDFIDGKTGKEKHQEKGLGEYRYRYTNAVCYKGADEFVAGEVYTFVPEQMVHPISYYDAGFWKNLQKEKHESYCACCGVAKSVYEEEGHDRACIHYEEEMYRLCRKWLVDPGEGEWKKKFDLAVEFLSRECGAFAKEIKRLRGDQ